MTITTAIIAAVAENGVIGDGDNLPWNIRSEMQHFVRTTLNKPVIMGRKTFESIGKPLPERTNIIITRDTNYKAEGIVVAHSLDDAIEKAKEIALEDEVDEIMIAGGTEIYKQAFAVAERMYITKIHINPEGNHKFPDFSKQDWIEVKSEFHRAKDGETSDFTIKIYDRK